VTDLSPTNPQDAEAVVQRMRDAAEAMLHSNHRVHGVVRLPATGHLLATGDLHDNPFHLRTIVRLAKLDAAPDRHVILQELIHGEKLINGMDFSHRMLIKVADFVCAYPDQVHPLLANHELAQMTGKGVSKGAGNSVDLFHDALEFTFGDAWEAVRDAINAFIRAMPIALISEGGVFCAHSLPGERAMKQFDAQIVSRAIDDADYQRPHGSAHLLVWGRTRSDAVVENLAAAWNVNLFCLGHEHAETGIEMRGSRVIILNSDHERGVVLPLDLANLPLAEEAVMSAIPLRAVATAREWGGGA
jgi:hypothetical protein